MRAFLSMAFSLVMFKRLETGERDERVAPGNLEVGPHHFLHQRLERGRRTPAELLMRLCRIAEQRFDFAGTELAWIHPDDDVPRIHTRLTSFDALDDADLVDAAAFKAHGDAQLRGSVLHEFAHAVLHAGGNHEV